MSVDRSSLVLGSCRQGCAAPERRGAMGEKFLPCFGQSWVWSPCLTQTLLPCTSFTGRMTATVPNPFHTGSAHPHPQGLHLPLNNNLFSPAGVGWIFLEVWPQVNRSLNLYNSWQCSQARWNRKPRKSYFASVFSETTGPFNVWHWPTMVARSEAVQAPLFKLVHKPGAAYQ